MPQIILSAATKYIGGGLIILAVALFFRMKHFENENAELKIEKIELEGQVKSRDAQILSQARSQARRTDAQKELNDVEADIAKQPESYECANSGAIRIALDQLRDKDAGASEADTSE